VRERLEGLRRDRFSPRAVAKFLGASAARSASIRRERPELARRARLWCAAGAGAWIAGATLDVGPCRRRLGTGLGWWGATSIMLDWHLGMVETVDGRPRNLSPADALTLARAWLVPVVADSPTPLLCAVGAATDVLDGALARRTQPTRAGRDLEGLVDTCFSLAALRGLAREGRLARGAAVAEATRLVAGTGVATLHYLGRVRAPDPQLAHAARSTAVVRCAGVIAAASGRRRLGDLLVVAGAAVAVALAGRQSLM